MTLTQIIAIMTPFLTLVPLASLLLTMIYQHNARLQESKIRRSDAIHDYSISLITALRLYTDTQLRYMSERLELEHDLTLGHSISNERSKHVYDLKDAAIREGTKADVISENAKLEISQVDFPGIHHEITKLVKHIQIVMNDPAYQDFSQLNLQNLAVLENTVKADITRLTLVLTETQDKLAVEIQALTFISPWRRMKVSEQLKK
ncbi:hypothetical protein [Lactovum odontotermitis]